MLYIHIYLLKWNILPMEFNTHMRMHVWMRANAYNICICVRVQHRLLRGLSNPIENLSELPNPLANGSIVRRISVASLAIHRIPRVHIVINVPKWEHNARRRQAPLEKEHSIDRRRALTTYGDWERIESIFYNSLLYYKIHLVCYLKNTASLKL